MRFAYPIPLELGDGEYQAALEAFCALACDARDAGLDPCVGIETTPDGDVWSIEVDDVGGGCWHEPQALAGG